MTLTDTLDTLILDRLSTAPCTERWLCKALDEHKATIHASLRRLVIRRQVTTAPPAVPQGVVRWAVREAS